MNIIDGVRKAAQSFVTLDDIALGQSLIEGGMSQLGRVGMSASGTSVAINVAARAVFLGAQVGTRSADKLAGTVSGFVPLAGETKSLAGKVSDQAKALGERCSTLAIHGIELAGGKKAKDPITKEEWLGKQAPQGYTSAELAADTTFGTLSSLAMMPFSVGMEMLQLATDGLLGNTFRKAVNASLGAMPGGSDQIESRALREGLVTVALDSGMPVAQSTMALIEAAARLALSDSRAMHRVLSTGLKQARLLADKDRKEVVPGVPSSAWLRKSARKVADNPPEAFMAALEKGPEGESAGSSAILKAMLKDGRALLTFFTLYPVILGLLGSDLSLLLVGGLADLRGAESYIDDDEGSPQPAAFNLLDSLVGRAVTEDDETPLFSRATVYLAQDLSFGACGDLRGREAALDRMERLFGAEVRERLTRDVSLNSDFMDEGEEGEEHPGRDARLRAYVRDTTDRNALSRQIDLCGDRLALLESSVVPDSLLKGQVSKRIGMLRAFTSLAAGDLAMRGAGGSVDREARAKFCDWASQQ